MIYLFMICFLILSSIPEKRARQLNARNLSTASRPRIIAESQKEPSPMTIRAEDSIIFSSPENLVNGTKIRPP